MHHSVVNLQRLTRVAKEKERWIDKLWLELEEKASSGGVSFKDRYNKNVVPFEGVKSLESYLLGKKFTDVTVIEFQDEYEIKVSWD